jgi:hypothetical protein
MRRLEDADRHRHPMLLIILGILAVAWAGVVLVVVAACASAARGDRALFAAHSLAHAHARPRLRRSL